MVLLAGHLRGHRTRPRRARGRTTRSAAGSRQPEHTHHIMAAKGTHGESARCRADQMLTLWVPLSRVTNHAVLSVPVKLLKEGEGHMVTVELKTGEVYRGLLVESEDTMNLHLSEGACGGGWGRRTGWVDGSMG